MKTKWMIMDCHVVFPMLPGETNEQAEDRLIETLYAARITPISLSNQETEENEGTSCEICKHYDCSNKDEPCAGCGDDKKNFELFNGGSEHGTD